MLMRMFLITFNGSDCPLLRLEGVTPQAFRSAVLHWRYA